jgi:PAS domain S-box-containing protein
MKLPKSLRLNSTVVFPLLTLIVCLLITYLAVNITKIEAKQKTQLYFDFRVREATNLINQRMQAYEQVLRGAAGLFTASNSVERHEFKQYVATLNLAKNYAGVQGVGFSLIVPSSKKTQHIASIRSEGFLEYTIRPEGQRDIYTSIIYLEPFSERNQRAFGYDMFNDPIRHAAMQKATDSGQTTLSGKVKLVQETGKQAQAGFLMYLPVYRNGTINDTPSERREHIIGWVYSPFRMNDLMAGLFGEHATDLDILIYDGESMSNESLLYDSDSSSLATTELSKTFQVQIADHAWTIHIHPLPMMNSRVDINHPKLVATIGTMMSILLSLIIWFLVTGRERALNAAKRMNNDLIIERQRLSSIIEGTHVGTWEWNVQTGETQFNDYWAKIIGYELSELEPISIETWMKLVHPDDANRSGELLEKHFSGELAYHECEARMRHKNGHWVWVLDRGKVATWTPDGKPLLMSGTHQEITERKQAEAALKESEFRWKFAIEGSGDGVWDWNVQTDEKIFSRRWKEILGYAELDKPTSFPEWEHRFHQEDESRAEKVMQDYLDGITPTYTFEGRMQSKDGVYKWVISRGMIVSRDDAGKALRMIGTLSDITERKHAEAIFHSFFEQSIFLAGILDQHGNLIEVNSTALNLIGARRDEVVGQYFPDTPWWNNENERMHLIEVLNSAQAGLNAGFEATHQTKDGEIINVMFSSTPVATEAGVYLSVIGIDITRRKNIETELLLHSNILESVAEGVFLIRSADSIIVFTNPQFDQMFGYLEGELVGQQVSIVNATTDKNPKEISETINNALRMNGEWHGEVHSKRKDGSTFWSGVSVSTFYHSVYGEVWVAVHSDITERKLTEKALRIAATAFEAQEGMMVADAQQTILQVNQAFTRLTGYSEDESVGRPVSMLKSGMHDAIFYRAMWESIRGEGYWQGEIWDRHKNGEVFLARMLISAVNDAKGNVTHYVASFIDITLNKQTETALVEAKAAAEQASKDKSRFLAAASHDLRQPLTALSLYVEVLTRQAPPNDDGLGTKIQGCVNSLSELLNDLLDVSKLDAGVVLPNLCDVPVNDLLQSMITIHSPEAEQKGLYLRVRPSTETLKIDLQLMHRIVGNLVFNAIRYTKKGGILIGYRRHRGKHWIEVWDTGIGIANKDLDHIFGEFTQLGDGARSRGSGLGLAIVDKTAKLLGIQVRVNSRLGKGSMFAIEVPLGHVMSTEVLTVIEQPSTRLTIAFVDDNLGILEAFSLALNAFGHEVISATSGRGLFKLLGSRKPDILVTDYRLADGENGLDLIVEARNLFTDNLPAILITGDTDPELLQTMAAHDVTVCHKPLKMLALDMLVREVVARNASTLSAQLA